MVPLWFTAGRTRETAKQKTKATNYKVAGKHRNERGASKTVNEIFVFYFSVRELDGLVPTSLWMPC